MVMHYHTVFKYRRLGGSESNYVNKPGHIDSNIFPLPHTHTPHPSTLNSLQRWGGGDVLTTTTTTNAVIPIYSSLTAGERATLTTTKIKERKISTTNKTKKYLLPDLPPPPLPPIHTQNKGGGEVAGIEKQSGQEGFDPLVRDTAGALGQEVCWTLNMAHPCRLIV